MKDLALAALLVVVPGSALADWCDPPIAPLSTAEDIARDYREELKAEFDQYFSDASRYTTCLENERTRVIEEMRGTAQRYERFLEDSAEWTE